MPYRGIPNQLESTIQPYLFDKFFIVLPWSGLVLWLLAFCNVSMYLRRYGAVSKVVTLNTSMIMQLWNNTWYNKTSTKSITLTLSSWLDMSFAGSLKQFLLFSCKIRIWSKDKAEFRTRRNCGIGPKSKLDWSAWSKSYVRTHSIRKPFLSLTALSTKKSRSKSMNRSAMSLNCGLASSLRSSKNDRYGRSVVNVLKDKKR